MIVDLANWQDRIMRFARQELLRDGVIHSCLLLFAEKSAVPAGVLAIGEQLEDSDDPESCILRFRVDTPSQVLTLLEFLFDRDEDKKKLRETRRTLRTELGVSGAELDERIVEALDEGIAAAIGGDASGRLCGVLWRQLIERIKPVISVNLMTLPAVPDEADGVEAIAAFVLIPALRHTCGFRQLFTWSEEQGPRFRGVEPIDAAALGALVCTLQ